MFIYNTGSCTHSINNTGSIMNDSLLKTPIPSHLTTSTFTLYVHRDYGKIPRFSVIVSNETYHVTQSSYQTRPPHKGDLLKHELLMMSIHTMNAL